MLMVASFFCLFFIICADSYFSCLNLFIKLYNKSELIIPVIVTHRFGDVDPPKERKEDCSNLSRFFHIFFV